MDERNDEKREPQQGWQGPPGENPADPQQNDHFRRKLGNSPGRLWAGLFMLLVGGVLLLDQMGFPLPDWLFSWHILLIAIGLFLGLRHNFRGGAWLILIMVGGCYLIQDFYPKTELKRFIGPCALIFIGFIIIFRPKRSWKHQPWRDDWKDQWHNKWHHKYQNDWHRNRKNWRYNYNRWHSGNPDQNQPGNPGQPGATAYPGGPTNMGNPGGPIGPTGQSENTPGNVWQGNPWQNPTPGQNPAGNQTDPNQTTGQTDPGGRSTGFGAGSGPYSSEDYIDTTSIFGGVHKKVVSKNFKGGDIVTFLGGSEIDLSQAEIYGTARLDVTQVMGGTKIIVPAHWEVRSEVTALFAGFEDKRQQPAMVNPDKVLIIDGTSIFGGIELKNY